MRATNFDFDAGALCLDFANTAEWHASDQPQEKLNDISDLIAWGEAAGILDEAQARAEARRAEEAPDAAEAELRRAIQLRETIYRIFTANALEDELAPADLARLNEALAQAMARAALRPMAGGFSWSWDADERGVALVRWAAARSAAELLTSDQLDRVRQCADDRGCGDLLVDTSRNRSRRWCSMKTCGNRAKAKRHYARQQ